MDPGDDCRKRGCPAGALPEEGSRGICWRGRQGGGDLGEGKGTGALATAEAPGFAGDAAAVEVLDRFAADPDAHKDEFEKKMAGKLAEDRPLRDEFAAALAEIRRAAPHIRVVQKMEEAEATVGLRAKRMSRGTAEVTQVIDKAKGTTGVDLDEIG